MPKPDAFYHTPKRSRGARSAGTDPRPGEIPDHGGQKTYVGDPDGMRATVPNVEANDIPAEKRKKPGADVHQPIGGKSRVRSN